MIRTFMPSKDVFDLSKLPKKKPPEKEKPKSKSMKAAEQRMVGPISSQA